MRQRAKDKGLPMFKVSTMEITLFEIYDPWFIQYMRARFGGIKARHPYYNSRPIKARK